MNPKLIIAGLVAITTGAVGFAFFPRSIEHIRTPVRILAWPGEHVTREDGSVICTLDNLIIAGTIASAKGWCKDWTIAPPLVGTVISHDENGRRWVRVGPRGGLQLHVEDRWAE